MTNRGPSVGPNKPKTFTSAYPGLSRVLSNKVRVRTAFGPGTDGQMQSAPEFDAVWDTGATNSVVTQEVIDQVGLVPTGVATVYTASGSHLTDTFLVTFGLPNMVAISEVRVSKGVVEGSDLLIGMDIIGKGDFAVTNFNGKTVFTFRMPSIERIDFNSPPPQKPVLRSQAKVGRNQLCPCGSGKKYKNCHG